VLYFHQFEISIGNTNISLISKRGSHRSKEIEFLSFKTNIYALWNVLKKDEFETNLIEVMRERDAEAANILHGVDKESISEIY